jgi:hypothetical protein
MSTDKWRFSGHYRTNEFSGGLTMNRFPSPKIAGRTLTRSASCGFIVDTQGGNRIPRIGHERRAIAAGHVVVVPAPPVKLDGRLSRDANSRNAAVAKRDEKLRWRPLPSRRAAVLRARAISVAQATGQEFYYETRS